MKEIPFHSFEFIGTEWKESAIVRWYLSRELDLFLQIWSFTKNWHGQEEDGGSDIVVRSNGPRPDGPGDSSDFTIYDSFEHALKDKLGLKEGDRG